MRPFVVGALVDGARLLHGGRFLSLEMDGEILGMRLQDGLVGLSRDDGVLPALHETLHAWEPPK